MPIPDYQRIMLPLLKFASDRKEHSSRDAIKQLSIFFSLTKEEENKLMPSGKARIFYIRAHWAISYLKHSLLLKGTKRGFFKITNRGIEVLRQEEKQLNNDYLRQFPEFRGFIGTRKKDKYLFTLKNKKL